MSGNYLARLLSMLVVGGLLLGALSGCRQTDATINAAPLDDTPRWIHQQTPHAKVAVVFVHGIIGSAEGTWKRANGTSFFDLLHNHPKAGKDVDIFAFGYASHAIASGSVDIQQAANILHEHLKHHGLLNYQSVVFVAHSMGGLVVMRELLTHRDLMERVPLAVFYATPQEGAHISNIARRLSSNPALEQMVPADRNGNRNGYLSLLDSEWKSVPAKARPVIRCAYETKPVGPVVIVEWDSGTRFCDGASLAISENHIDIVKPDRADHNSVIFLLNALDEYVLTRAGHTQLETPDFIRADGQLIFPLANPFGRQAARLINTGRSQLTYTITQLSDPSLYVWPADTPRAIPGDSTEQLQFALAFGARAAEYTFVLKSDAAEDQKVTVRVANPQALLDQQSRMASRVSQDINKLLAQPKSNASWGSPGDGGAAQQDIVAAAFNTVKEENPKLPEVAQLVLTAEVLKSANWPDLAMVALKKAEHVSPASFKTPAIQHLHASTVRLARQEGSALPQRERLPASSATQLVQSSANPLFQQKQQLAEWNVLSQRLKDYAALKSLGFKLEGNILLSEGQLQAASNAFNTAAAVKPAREPKADVKLEEKKRLTPERKIILNAKPAEQRDRG